MDVTLVLLSGVEEEEGNIQHVCSFVSSIKHGVKKEGISFLRGGKISKRKNAWFPLGVV